MPLPRSDVIFLLAMAALIVVVEMVGAVVLGLWTRDQDDD